MPNVKRYKPYKITYNGIAFSGYSTNGQKAIFGNNPLIFSNYTNGRWTKVKLEAQLKNPEDVVGLEDFELPLKLKLEVVEVL